MDFEIEQQLAGAPDAVQRLLLDSAFLAARAGLPKLGGSEVVERTVDAERARLRVRMRFTGDLAPAVTAVIDRERLTWVDDATIDLAARTGSHAIVPDHYPDRLTCQYEETLRAVDRGTQRVLQGALRVRMPIVGGRVERAIVSGLREFAAAEGTLIDDWLGRGAH
jgi:hypothetical protein